MRESLSVFSLRHWKKNFWNGHYLWLMKQWGVRCIILDTLEDIRRWIYELFGCSITLEWSNKLQRYVECVNGIDKRK
jgi:hypothetical protein